MNNTVDQELELAAFIRSVDGNNSLGASQLAEKIIQWQAARAPGEQSSSGGPSYEYKADDSSDPDTEYLIYESGTPYNVGVAFNETAAKAFCSARRDNPEPSSAGVVPNTYSPTQSTKCAGCLQVKHTPLRVDQMGGYVCLTCIDKKLNARQIEGES